MIAGVDTLLPDRLAKLLVKAFDDGMFGEADVPDSDDVLDEDDIKARLLIWNAVVDDVCKAQSATVLSRWASRTSALALSRLDTCLDIGHDHHSPTKMLRGSRKACGRQARQWQRAKRPPSGDAPALTTRRGLCDIEN